MKPSFFILITFLTMLAAHSAYSYSGYYKGACGVQGYPSCTCTDPGCKPADPFFDTRCIDAATCCKVFGNVGETPENMEVSSNSYYEQYASASAFPPYVLPARRSYKGD